MKTINLPLTKTRVVTASATVLMMLVLSGCSDTLTTKKNLVQYGPDERNLPQEVEEMHQRQVELVQLQTDADEALSTGNFDRADALYQDILKLDANNLRAQEGLRRVNSHRQHQAWLGEAKPLVGKSPEDEEHAKELLRRILAEDPYNHEAASLYREIMAAEELKRIEALKVKLKYDSPVSLEFRDTELKVIIEALAKGTGINFTLDNDVQSNLRASIFVRNVPLDDALDMLVQSNGLRKKVLAEDSVLIYPDKTVKVRQYQDLIIRSFYLEYAEPAKVAATLSSMLGIKQVETDERLPVIMIKDVPEVMPLVEKLIAAQDLPEPEVMLEMAIIEVSRTVNQNTGIDWPTSLTVLPATGLTLEALKNTSSSTIGVSPSPSLLFDGEDVEVNLLSNPRIRVKNGDSAKIHIGDRVPIITSNVSSTGVISENVQYIDIGLKLDAEPTINLGGDVNIKLSLDVSTLGTSTKTNSGSVVYQIGTRNTSTQLRLKDGETQVLAGLITDNDRVNVNKIPGLGDIPGLGRLFSSHDDQKKKTELVLMITPRIIRQHQAPNAAVSEYWVGSELEAGRSFTQPRTREEISKLFKVGTLPQAARSTPEPEEKNTKPEGLNITLPPGIKSQF